MSQIVSSQTVVLDANGRAILSNANFIFIISASLPVSVQLKREGSTEDFASIQAGLQVGRLQRWSECRLTGTAGATIQLFYGYTSLREDVTVFNQQIATIAGTVAVADLPASTLTDTADTTQAASTQTAISANLARRRITIGVLSTSGNGVRVSFSGAANTRGIEVQPGTFVEFRNTAALVVRNADLAASAANAVWYAEEEA